jgi:hypothetical protein
MSRSPFGWDLPPGCAHKMIDDACGADNVTELQENEPDPDTADDAKRDAAADDANWRWANDWD